MSIESALEADLPILRAEALALMTVTLTAYSPGGNPIVNGFKVHQYTNKGSTFGRLQGPSRTSRDTATRYVTIGSVPRPVLEAGLHIPLDAVVPVPGQELGKGWEYEITAVGDLDDPALVGRRYLVVGVPAKSLATARRLDIVEL